jgi:uncharacterized protein (DUF427 family)
MLSRILKETIVSANSGPGYAQKPDHRITTKPADVRVQVTFDGELIADSANAIRMDEGSYPPVYYVPRTDVKTDRLARTTHSTYCPFKGHASYYSVVSGARTAENAVWSYEQPYDEVMVIKEYLAFYPNKVEIKT